MYEQLTKHFTDQGRKTPFIPLPLHRCNSFMDTYAGTCVFTPLVAQGEKPHTHNPMMIAHMIICYKFQHQPIEKYGKYHDSYILIHQLKKLLEDSLHTMYTLPISNGHQPGGRTNADQGHSQVWAF